MSGSIALFVTLITLIPSVATLPVVRYLGGGQHVIENPLKDKVEAVVDCGYDYEKLKFDLLPRTREFFTAKTPEGNIAVCLLEMWRRVP